MGCTSSNSGDILSILVPNFIFGGDFLTWVTIQKSLEIEKDNRGTKSTLKVVKAQRINGGGHSNTMFKIYSTVGFSAVTGKSVSRPFLSNNKFITPCEPHGGMVRNISSLSNTITSDKIAY